MQRCVRPTQRRRAQANGEPRTRVVHVSGMLEPAAAPAQLAATAFAGSEEAEHPERLAVLAAPPANGAGADAMSACTLVLDAEHRRARGFSAVCLREIVTIANAPLFRLAGHAARRHVPAC
jgi:hypothetical protein